MDLFSLLIFGLVWVQFANIWFGSDRLFCVQFADIGLFLVLFANIWFGLVHLHPFVFPPMRTTLTRQQRRGWGSCKLMRSPTRKIPSPLMVRGLPFY
jgi:hypothetical protein